MEEHAPPLFHSWQFYHTCKRLLGDAFLQKLFQRSLRQIQRWSADPDFTTDHERNPMDRYEVLLARLMELGREDVARSAVSRQAHVVNAELRLLEDVDPDVRSIPEKCLDDLPALANFHHVLLSRGKHQIDEVRAAWQMAKRELDEDFELWVRLHAEELPSIGARRKSWRRA